MCSCLEIDQASNERPTAGIRPLKKDPLTLRGRCEEERERERERQKEGKKERTGKTLPPSPPPSRIAFVMTSLSGERYLGRDEIIGHDDSGGRGGNLEDGGK